MEFDFNEIKQNLSSEEIIFFVTEKLEAHTYLEREDCIIFPTICHNIESDKAKMKLYYYKNSKLFRCYTECQTSFDIFDLFKKYYTLRKINYNFYDDILYQIIDKTSYIKNDQTNRYISILNKYNKINRNIELEKYPESILEIYSKNYPVEWTCENISDSVMNRFNIRFSISENKVIIPHYDINNNLIGIRGRALDEYQIENFGKYAPVKIQNKWYSHPLSLNLYGINFNKDAIKEHKKVILFEGEKSILLYDQYFGSKNNITLAVCGNSFNILQLKLLIKNFPLEEIIIAFDKDFEKYPSVEADKYYDRIKSIILKYKKYCNFSFIYDYKNLLRLKQSPIDAGPKIFTKLLKERENIK